MEKAKSIVFEDEIQRFIDLGLGRGVDATKPSPWVNKSSFLVRTATYDNIIGTDEGGFLQNYKSSIDSTCEVQAQLKASVSLPNTPVSLGMEGEISRSTNNSKKVVGKKAVNRTISFRMDHSTEHQPSGEDQTDVPASTPPSFEEVISNWILKRISDRTENKQLELKEKSTAALTNYLLTASKAETALVAEDCSDFVNFYGITHYVNSITLGASEHSVLSESEYSRVAKEGLNVSSASVASAQQKFSSSSKVSKSFSSSQSIGKITDDKVERGSNNEAVIGIKILPINSLIHKNRFIYLSLHKALMDYTEERTIKPTGPYLIECGDEKMYWKVDSECQLNIATDIKDASVFHIYPCEDTDDPYDFTIGWFGKTLRSMIKEDSVISADEESIYPRIIRYLEVKTFFCGHYAGPLKVCSQLSAKDSRLCLYKQLPDDFFDTPGDISPWLTGNRVYFISSANRKSFIAINRHRTTHQDETSEVKYRYSARCVDSQKCHDEKSTWMLFRLLPADHCVEYCGKALETKKVTSAEKQKGKLSEELTKLLEK